MMMRYRRVLRTFTLTLTLGLTIPLFGYVSLCLLRPPRKTHYQILFPGVTYQRWIQEQPRWMVIHVVALDRHQGQIKPFVTPGQPKPRKIKFPAQTTADFVKKYGVQVAINGSFFTPFYSKHPLDYFPKKGDRVYAIGQVISDGVSQSPPQKDWGVLCFIPPQQIQIVLGQCPPGTEQGLAGREILLHQGRVSSVLSSRDQEDLYPRSAIAFNEQQLWLVVVDGRQPFYSEGITLSELTELLQDLGATEAINLDGGGSSTLMIQQNSQPVTLNSPIHTRIPLRQRPVANHLGFFVSPAAEARDP